MRERRTHNCSTGYTHAHTNIHTLSTKEAPLVSSNSMRASLSLSLSLSLRAKSTRTHHILQISMENCPCPRALSVCLCKEGTTDCWSGPAIVLYHVCEFNDKLSLLVLLTRFKGMFLQKISIISSLNM